MFNHIRILIICLILFSCEKKAYCPDTEINVPMVLQEIKTKENEKYCSLVYGSVKGEKEFIIKLTNMELANEKNVPLHGEVLIRIIHFLGEEKFLASISDFNQMEKLKLFSYVRIGLINIKDKEFKHKELETIFPMLNDFLKSNP